MKKIILTLLLLILTNCTPTYRIITIDYDYNLITAHKYEILNIKTGEIDTIYDFKYYLPGMYVKISKDPTATFKIVDIVE